MKAKYKFERTCDYLFQRTASEVDRRIKANNLKNLDVDAEREPLVSRIRNNKRVKDINRNLIPYSMMNNLQSKLDFTDVRELFWGSDEIIHGYVKDLFQKIMLDILEERCNDELYHALHNALIDYVPYAQWTVYADVSAHQSEENTRYFFGYEKNQIIENTKSAKANAIARLYAKTFEEVGYAVGDIFTEKFIELTHKTKTYSKTDPETKKLETEVNNRGFFKLSKSIQEFAIQELQPLFVALEVSKESLGKRVYSLLMEDVPPVLNQFTSLEQNQSDYNNQLNTKSYGEILIASNEYVKMLNKIQSNDERYDWTPLETYLYFEDE